MKENRPSNNGTDPDEKLSRDFNKVLNRDLKRSDIDDPLFHLLSRARDEDQHQRREIPVAGKESVWEAVIESAGIQSTGTGSVRKTRITPIYSRNRWLKVAAAILLVACASLLLMIQFSDSGPELLAEAGSSLETVELADGSSVTLRPNSSLYEISVTEDRHTYSLSGEALFDVVSSEDRTFTVEAGPGRVVVTGTRFNLDDRDQKARVFLIEGGVRFETSDGSGSVDLEPGEASEIDNNRQVVQPFTFESDLVTGWTQNRLSFRDRQAGSIIRELEFHFDIRISVPAEIEQEALGGTIQLDNVRQSLDDLGVVLGGSFEQTGESDYEYRPQSNE